MPLGTMLAGREGRARDILGGVASTREVPSWNTGPEYDVKTHFLGLMPSKVQLQSHSLRVSTMIQ